MLEAAANIQHRAKRRRLRGPMALSSYGKSFITNNFASAQEIHPGLLLASPGVAIDDECSDFHRFDLMTSLFTYLNVNRKPDSYLWQLNSNWLIPCTIFVTRFVGIVPDQSSSPWDDTTLQDHYDLGRYYLERCLASQSASTGSLNCRSTWF